MAGEIVRAVQVRSAIARWLLTGRLVEWQLAVVNVAEGHSASEGFFHRHPGDRDARRAARHRRRAPACRAGSGQERRLEECSLNGPGARPRTAQGDALPVPWDHLPYAVGANAGFQREVIDGVGGWNPRYDTAGEDIDVCWRALHAGFRIGFVPEAVVHYRHRSEMRAVRAQQIRYGRAAAKLHRDHRRHGLRRGPLSGPARVWGKVAVSAPLALVRPEYRTTLHIALGYGWGSTTGMLTERAWPY